MSIPPTTVSSLAEACSRQPELGALPEIFDLRQEVVAVIGGTGTLGGLMAEAVASFGARVVIMGRNEERGKKRVQRINAAGGIGMFQTVDAMDSSSISEAIAIIRDELGPTTVLINAAGGNSVEATVQLGESLSKIPEEAWRNVFDLNLMGGGLIPAMVFGDEMVKEGRGSIINIASMAGMNPVSRVGAYSAAKAAVINLTKYLALEWATRGVRVNSISPGFFPAEQNKGLLYNKDGSLTDRSAKIIGHTPMARFGSANELAGVAVWLASQKASSFVTGQNIVVDGGFSVATI